MAILGPYNASQGYSPGYAVCALPPKSMYAIDMANLRFRAGSVSPRCSIQVVNSTSLGSGNPFGLTTWNDTVNSKLALVALSNLSKLFIGDITSYNPNSSSIAFTDRTGAITLSSSALDYYTFDSLNNILIGTGNSGSSGVPFKVTAWNANAANLGGSPPSGNCVKQVNNFLFISRDLSSTANQSKVYWSNVNDPETWNASNVLNFNKNDGEPIMALGSIGTDLFIFKKTSIGKLSTVTLTTSGAVTLGPLVTVIRGIGCAGPLALDNIPNGNIIFLGYDGHVYEFDGSTLVDISLQPYPGPNVYNLPETKSGYIPTMALMNVSNVSVIKTRRGLGEVWITPGSPIPLGATWNNIIWDFNQRIWQGYTTMENSGILIYASAPLSVTAFYESPDLFFHANSSNQIISWGNTTIPYATDQTLSQVQMNLQIAIHFGIESSTFVPISLLLETTASNSTNARLQSLSIFADFDKFGGAIPMTQVYTTTTMPLPNRIVVPLTKLKQDSAGTNVKPSYITVLIQALGTGSTVNNEVLRIGNLYLSDEVMS